VKTTLVEGVVLVNAESGAKAILKPNQQAELDKTGAIKTNSNPDIDEVIAFKNDWFYFPGTGINSIMRQLQRWYVIEVKYEATSVEKFHAIRIPRSVPLSKVLQYLEATERIHFKIEGNSVTVMR